MMKPLRVYTRDLRPVVDRGLMRELLLQVDEFSKVRWDLNVRALCSQRFSAQDRSRDVAMITDCCQHNRSQWESVVRNRIN